jgi:hypothetical protein
MALKDALPSKIGEGPGISDYPGALRIASWRHIEVDARAVIPIERSGWQLPAGRLFCGSVAKPIGDIVEDFAGVLVCLIW